MRVVHCLDKACTLKSIKDEEMAGGGLMTEGDDNTIPFNFRKTIVKAKKRRSVKMQIGKGVSKKRRHVSKKTASKQKSSKAKTVKRRKCTKSKKKSKKTK